MLVVTIQFSTDEAEFLATALGRAGGEGAPAAEKFWLEKLQHRVYSALQDVVAADAAQRLAMSASPGFPFAAPPPAPPPAASGFCSCGNPAGSPVCKGLRQRGLHP